MNPSSVSKWSTMAEIGQTEFQPLFGYFINNKVGTTTTLTLNYQENVAPNQRFFSRNLIPGWNSIGVANPSYALKQKDPSNIDTNNVKNITDSISSSTQSIYDLTANQSLKYATKVSDSWSNAIYNDANSLNDFRETKAYIVFNTSAGVYNGFQNNDQILTCNPSNDCSVPDDSDMIYVSKKSTTPSDSDAIKGAKDVVSLIANVRADEAIIADGLYINYSGATTSSFENAKVYVNGVLLGSFDPAAGTGDNVLIDSSVSFNKGDNEVKVTVNVKTDAVTGVNIKFEIISGTAPESFLDGQSAEFVVSGNAIAISNINGSAEGAKITVQGADMTVVRNDGLSDGNKIVKGSKDVTLAKYNVKALYDDIRITSVTLDSNTHASATQRINDSSVYDAKLFINGVQVGSTRDFNGGASFSSLSTTIAKDAIASIEIKASFDTASTGYLKTNLNIYAEDSRGKTVLNTTGYATVDNLITDEGSLSVAVGADTKVASILLAKAGVEQEVAQYRLTAIDDAANITELTATTSADIDPRISEYRLYKGTTLLATENPLSGVTTFKITGDKLIVAANSNETVTIKAVLNPITSKSQTHKALQTTVTGYKFKSSGGTETATTTLYLQGNAMDVRKTAPTFALISGVTGGQGSLQNVMTFSVTADSNEDVLLNSLTFTKSGSASGTAAVSNYYLYTDGTEKAAITSGTTFTPGAAITIAKGTTKTFTVKADTSGVPVDARFGLVLERGADGANVSWSEYFVDGPVLGTATNLISFPLNGSTMMY
jgi:hypothetical protein